MAAVTANNVSGKLANSLDNIVTTIVLQTGNGAQFPALTGAQYFYATISNVAGTIEIVQVTARVSDTLTVVRGVDNTSVRAWVAGDSVQLRVVAALLNSKVDTSTAVVTGTLTVAGAATFASSVTAVSFSGQLTGSVIGNVAGSATTITTVLPIALGGTGSATAASALTALGAQPALGFTPANVTALASYAPLASPAMTGVPTISGAAVATQAYAASQASTAQTNAQAFSTAALTSYTSGVAAPSNATFVGVLSIAKGGTGASSLAAGYAYSNGSVLTTVTLIPAASVSGLAASATVDATQAANITGSFAAAQVGITGSGAVTPGWRRSADGYIEQWGTTTTQGDSSGSVTYPIAFTLFGTPSISGTPLVSTTATSGAVVTSASKTGFAFYASAGDTSNTGPAWWYATGY